MGKKAAEAAAARSKKKGSKTSFGYIIAVGSCGGVVVLALFLAATGGGGPKSRNTGNSPLDTLVNDNTLIGQVNRQDNFTAAASPFFNKWSLADIKYGFDGARFMGFGFVGMPGAVQYCEKEDTFESGPLPAAFDLREKHPGCLSDVYDSGNCTSSYAIAAATSLAARFCVHDDDKYKGIRLASQQILSCDKKSKGCGGGGIDGVWNYVKRRGLFPEECLPYAGKKGAECKTTCDESRKLKAISNCVLRGETRDIKREIHEQGPIVAPMNLMADFLVYSGGIYTPTDSATPMFGSDGKPVTHAVIVIGWGKDKGIPYWVIQNSFGEGWGEKGYAKVAIGEALLEQAFIAGYPATAEALERKSKDDQIAAEKKEQLKKERAERDVRIAAKKAERDEATSSQELDDLDDDFEADVELDDLDVEDGETEM